MLATAAHETSPVAEDKIFPLDRIRALGAVSTPARALLDELIPLAKFGLPQMHRKNAFVHTVRLHKTEQGKTVRGEGDNLRYAINVALGLSFLDINEQRHLLGGTTANDLIQVTAARAELSDDPGAVALAAWTAAEARGLYAGTLLRRLEELLSSGKPVATVDCAWILLAAVAARELGDTRQLTAMARARLLEEQSVHGLFPHRLPASSNGRLRAHIGCFADQVYAIQGFSRLWVAEGDQEALAAAEACAARIVALQGSGGQWWWHYDVRDGSVVEGYPVYSVHQHAMAPMALLDLREAGGTDYLPELAKGLNWLKEHPEVDRPLIDHELAVVWRKVGRREPNKAVRAISALSTAVHHGLKVPGLDTFFPPVYVDEECRPYELGWMLYGWLCGGTVRRLAHNQPIRTFA